MIKEPYTFHQFIAACESDDFNEIDEYWLEWANDFIIKTDHYMKYNYHDGDCTNQPVSCPICTIEALLSDYREYFFNPEKWKDDNGL